MTVSFDNFISSFVSAENSISLVEMGEFVMGGPPIGKLKINGEEPFPKCLFSGPMIVRDHNLYIPQFEKRFFEGPGFVLVSIDMLKRTKDVISNWQHLILLRTADGESVSYYTDVENLNECRVLF